MRTIALVIVLAIASGCAARQMPGPELADGSRFLSERERRAALVSYVATLPPGGRVTVTTIDGERFAAILLKVEGDEVLLQPRGRLPEAPRAMPLAQIGALEPDRGSSSVAKAAVIGVAAGAATFLGLLYVTLLLIGD